MNEPLKIGTQRWIRLVAYDRAMQLVLAKPSRDNLDQEEILLDIFRTSDRVYTHLISVPKGK